MAWRIGGAGVLGGSLALGLGLALGAPAPSARPGATAPSSLVSSPAGALADVDTLLDASDRALPLAGRPRVHAPGAFDLVIADDARQRAVRAQLGAGWRLASTGRGPDSWVLHGPAVRLDVGAGFAAVRGLVARLPELFGLDASDALEPVFDRSSDASGAVRMRQIVDGARVAGADVIATFDADGRLAALASSFRTTLPAFARPAIDAAEARARARADLTAAFPGIELAGASRTEAWIWPLDSGPGRVWIVHQATRRPWGSFRTRIDAATGAVLARENAAQAHGRVGEGIVYKSNADYPDRESTRKLTDILGSDVDPAGHLDGRHVTVLNEKGPRVASENLRYLYYPFTQWDAFDQVSAYYHLQRARARFRKELGVRDLPWFDGPEPVTALANVRGLCNAYYTTDLAGDGKPGFAFGDQMTCDGINGDFARDSDVVYHEYTHAIVDWEGIGLQDAPIHSYQRAIGEADADYHAAEFTGDPQVGEVLGFPRNIANAKRYPEDVACRSGSPEEHCTGEIWSGFLWDLRETIRGAERLEFTSLDYLVDHPDVSHTPVWLDFWDATMALIEADEHMTGGKHAGTIYGLAASRGIFGPAVFSGDQMGFLYQDLPRGTRFRSIGRVEEGTPGVPFYFNAPAGSTVSIKVKSTSGLHPDFLLGEALAYPLEYFSAAALKNAREAILVEELPPVEGLYVVTVRGADSTDGSFQVSIVVKQ